MRPTIRFIYGLAAGVVSRDVDLRAAIKMLAEDIAKDRSEYPDAIAFLVSNISDDRSGGAIVELCLAAARLIGRNDLIYHCSHQAARLALSSGKYERAIDLLKNNIIFLRKNRYSGAYRLLLVREYLNLAHALNSLGRTEEALGYCLAGLKHDSMLPAELRNGDPFYRLVLADAHNTVACIYKDAGKIEESLGYFSRARTECAEIEKEVDDPMIRELMSGISNNQGLAYEVLARTLKHGEVDLKSPNIASLMQGLGCSNSNVEQAESALRRAALDSFEQALELINGTGNTEFYCRQLINLARNLEDTDPKRAIAHLKSAREEARRAGFPEIAINALTNIAAYYYKEGKSRAAYLILRETFKELEAMYGNQMTIPVRNRVLSENSMCYELAAQCCFDLSYLDKALGYVERTRSRALLYQMLNREFCHARRKSRKADDRFSKFLLHQLGDEKSSDFTLEYDQHGISKARHLLGSGRRILIEMFFTTSEMICLLVGGSDIGHGNEAMVVRVPMASRQWMSKLVEDFWLIGYANRNRGSGASAEWLRDVLSIGAHLGDRIWPAIEAPLHHLNPSHLVLVPHLGLQFLPLHLMLLGSDGVCLLDRFNVSYAPSLSVLSVCRRLRRGNLNDRLLLLGDPTEDLVYAGLESVLVGAFFEKKDLFFQRDATVEAFYSNSASAGVVHLACHGSFSADDPSNSALRLANGSLAVQDLGARAASTFSPGSTAVLSACESGVVALDQVDEFIGLPYGFFAGGCSTVVCSLWPVDDLATALLMGRFYLYLVQERLTKPEALARAQRWVRDATNAEILNYIRSAAASWSGLFEQEIRTKNDPDARPFAHPSFWGSFVCHGYWH